MSEAYLDSLNNSQLEAVTDFDHTLLVLAGAGSGKTRVITTKIVHAMKEMHYQGWQILAVTFTNKAAREMLTRVETMLGDDADTSGLEIKTFHSYGAGLLRRYSGKLGYTSSFTIYDDSDSQALLASLFPDDNKNLLKDIAKRISLLKDRDIRPDDRSSVLEAYENEIPGFLLHYRAYERKLRENQCFDFADLIMKTNELLEENQDVRDYLRRRYRLILVDEYQDSNSSQFRMLKNIVGPATQLVVVGDDDQSIYRFRGAEIENILHFKDDYDNVRTIKLEENYRSTKSIIRLSGELIKHNRKRHQKTLFTNNEEGPRPKLLNCFNGNDEATRIANVILSNLGQMDTAILFRTNAQSRAFEQILVSFRIKYQLVGALRFYEREEVKDILALFSLLLNPRDQVAFSRVINKPARGIGKTSIQKILLQDEDTVSAMRSIVQTSLLTRGARSGVEDFLKNYDEAVRMLESDTALKEVAGYCITAFGFYEHYSSESDPAVRQSRLDNLNDLVTAVSEYPPSRAGLASFLESITLDSSSLPGAEETNRISSDRNVVKLITMHNTKGLEFDRVFVTGLEDDIIPGNRADATDRDIEEERRILYVALTRAKKELYLSWSMERMLWGQTVSQAPTRFFKDIPEDCYEGTLASTRTVSWSASSYTNRYSFRARRAESALDVPCDVFDEPPVKKVERKRNDETFCLNDRVVSPDYGQGTIVSVDERGDKTIIRVSFDNGRKAIYNAAFCNLKKLQQKE